MTRKLFVRVCCIVGVVLGGGGCDCSAPGDGVAGPITEIVDEGSGDENVEPLWPLREGARLDVGATQARDVMQTLAPVTIGGRVAFPVAVGGRDAGFGQFRPSEPQHHRWFAVDDNGDVLLLGTPNDGVYDHPALWVPAKVRVGMQWRATVAEKARFTITVVSRDVEDTIYGSRPVWRLQIIDEHARISNDDGTLTPAGPPPLVLIEGRGPATISASSNVEVTTAAVGVAVFPIDPGDVAPSSRARLPLTPLHGGLPLLDRFLPTSFDAIVDGDGGAAIGVNGLVFAVGVSIDGSATFGTGSSFGCFGVKDGSDDVEVVSGDLCLEPRVVVVGDNGAIVDGLSALDVRQELCVEDFDGQDRCKDYVFNGLGDDDEGVRHVFGLSEERATFGPREGERVEIGVEMERWRHRNGGLYLLSPAEDGTNVGVEHAGSFDVARFDDDNAVDGRFAAASLVDPLNVAARPGGRDLVRSTPDGHVDLLVVRDDGVDVVSLGDLALPRRHWLAGAVVVGDRLIAITVTGFHGFDGGTDGTPAALGDVYFWSAPFSPAAAVAGGARGALEVRALPHGAQLCWPKRAGPADLSGWTWNDTPTRAVVSGEGNCVAVEDTIDDGDPGREGLLHFEGPVPGVGRVAVGLSAAFASSARAGVVDGGVFSFVDGSDLAAALVDGGLVSPRYRFAAGGALSGPVRFDPLTDALVADQAGNGLWVLHRGVVDLLGATAQRGFFDGGTLGSTLLVPVAGGGVLLEDGTLVRPDGSVEQAADPQPGSFVLDDGRVCSDSSEPGLRCVDEDGVAVEIAAAHLGTALAVVDDVAYFLSAEGDGAVWRADIDDGSAAPVDLTVLEGGGTRLGAIQTATSSSGEAYAVVEVVDDAFASVGRLVRFHRDAIARVPVAEAERVPLPRLAVENSVFLVDGVPVARSVEVSR